MNYPWYIRLIAPLNIYFKFYKRLCTLVNCKETSDKTKLMSIKMMLTTMEEDLIEAEREVLTQQFPMSEDDVMEAQDKFQAGSVNCNVFLN